MPLTSVVSGDGHVVIGWSLAEPPEQVWAALVGRDALPQWLGQPVELDLQTGGSLVIDHGDGTLSRSTLAVVDAPSRLVMSWVFPDEPESRVAVGLEASEDGTDLVLAHDRLGDLAVSYTPGWITHLTYLEAVVDGEPLAMSRFWHLYATHEVLVHEATATR